MRLPCLPSRLVGPCGLYPHVIGLIVAPLTFFLRMVSMALVLWGVGAILWNGYGVQGQNYVALLLGSEMTGGFYYRNWILRI